MGLEMFYNKTVTLFNRSFNAETEEEKYFPTLLENVNLVETKNKQACGYGVLILLTNQHLSNQVLF